MEGLSFLTAVTAAATALCIPGTRAAVSPLSITLLFVFAAFTKRFTSIKG